MILVNTPGIPGLGINNTLGLVSAETVMGANVVRDMFANLRDIIGGRSGMYETVLTKGREKATSIIVDKAKFLGANAIVGIQYDFEVLGKNGSIMLVAVTGTAVIAGGSIDDQYSH
jgi:uncharacterized protein YbjQ (UPF0145 family)